MSTVKFTDISPYKQVARIQHHTDIKYKRYIDDSGLSKSVANDADSKQKTSASFSIRNVALFGLGRAGSIHVMNIASSPKLRLVYIVEADPERAKTIQKEFVLEGTTILTPEQEDIVFKDAQIDGVIIATPTFTHEAIVTKGLKSGKAVLCEKPISQNEEGIMRCYKVAEEVKRPLMCAFNRRYEPGFKEVYDQVREGRVGRVHLIKTVSRDSPMPSLEYIKVSGGIFHDCAVHDIDTICWILGEYPVKVFATAHSFIPEIQDIGEHDTVAMTLVFPSGTIGMVDLSRNAVYGYDMRLEVFGPKGVISLSNERPMEVSFTGVDSHSSPPIYHSFASRFQEGYKHELKLFHNVMEGKSVDYVTGDHTLKISKIATAFEESVRTEKLVIVPY